MFARNDLSTTNGSASLTGGVSPSYLARVKVEVQPGESPIAWLQLDLDADLRFADGLVVLTDRRLIAFEPQNGQPTSSAVEAWPLYATSGLVASEHAGVGSLELFSG